MFPAPAIFSTLALMGPAEWILIIGAAAVFVIIAQRDYQRYKLQKAAIEKGLTLLPTGAPLWLASLKTGILVLALGVGLITMGSIGLAKLPDPATMQPPGPNPNKIPIASTTKPADTQGGSQPIQPQPQFQGGDFPRGPGMGGPGPGGRGPGGPGPDGMGPGPDGPRPIGPDGRPIPMGPDGRPLPPRQLQQQPGFAPGEGPREGDRPNPRRDAEDGRRICHWAIGAGGVIAIIGLALTLFAFFERKYVTPVNSGAQK